MSARRLSLTLLPDELAICRLPADASLPQWTYETAGFRSITFTSDEVSVVCGESAVPDQMRCERGWRVFKIEGPFAFDETGILHAVAQPLKDAGIGIFALSTFDTDYVLVKAANVERAAAVLRDAGHAVQ